VIESYVDLTYRGVSLGRRIKLTQVRPSSGYLELPTPMPVGTQLAVATDEGVAFDATVTWIYEQVGGADRGPGMIVRPRLTSDLAAAWWTERVALPDEEPVRVTRTRPVTARPRTHSKPVPVAPEPVAERSATIVADLNARVAAAAGVVVAPAAPEPPRAPEPEPVIRRTGEHDVVDDGYATMIMASVDPTAIGLDAEVTDPGVTDPGVTDPGMSLHPGPGHPALDDAAATTQLPAASAAGPAEDDAGATTRLAASNDAGTEGEPSTQGGAEAADDEGAAPDPAERGTEPPGGDDRPPRRGWFRRRSKRP
jgi:hypothetical protein